MTWTLTRPTKPGYYLFKNKPDGKPRCLTVDHGEGGLVVYWHTGEWDVEAFFGWWFGPIPFSVFNSKVKER